MLQLAIVVVIILVVLTCIKLMETIERFRCCRKKCCQPTTPNTGSSPAPSDDNKVLVPPNTGSSPTPPDIKAPIDASEFMDGDEFVLPKTEAEYGAMAIKFGGRSDGWSYQRTGLDLPPLPPHVTIDLGNGGSLKIPNGWPSIQELKLNRCPPVPYPKEIDLLCFRFPQGESTDYFFTRDYNYSQSFGFGAQDMVLKFQTDNVVSSTGFSSHYPNGRRKYQFFENEPTMSRISYAEYAKERGDIFSYFVRPDSIGLTMLIIIQPDVHPANWEVLLIGYNRMFYKAEHAKSFEQWINFATYGKFFIHPKNVKIVWNMHYPSISDLHAQNNLTDSEKGTLEFNITEIASEKAFQIVKKEDPSITRQSFKHIVFNEKTPGGAASRECFPNKKQCSYLSSFPALGHELLHTLGLGHAGSGKDGYGDPTSQGHQHHDSINPAQLYYMGLITPIDIDITTLASNKQKKEVILNTADQTDHHSVIRLVDPNWRPECNYFIYYRRPDDVWGKLTHLPTISFINSNNGKELSGSLAMVDYGNSECIQAALMYPNSTLWLEDTITVGFKPVMWKSNRLLKSRTTLVLHKENQNWKGEAPVWSEALKDVSYKWITFVLDQANTINLTSKAQEAQSKAKENLRKAATDFKEMISINRSIFVEFVKKGTSKLTIGDQVNVINTKRSGNEGTVDNGTVNIWKESAWAEYYIKGYIQALKVLICDLEKKPLDLSYVYYIANNSGFNKQYNGYVYTEADVLKKLNYHHLEITEENYDRTYPYLAGYVTNINDLPEQNNPIGNARARLEAAQQLQTEAINVDAAISANQTVNEMNMLVNFLNKLHQHDKNMLIDTTLFT